MKGIGERNNMEEWKEYKLKDIIQFNPLERIPKGTKCRKIGMDQLSPFCRYVYSNNYDLYKGGTKFRNGDTIMARITPCLENGKTAYVSSLGDDEVAFGSTEFIVMRKIENVSDSKFIYYLSISPTIRDIAIKSMIGSSGRQRVQQDVLENLKMKLPSSLDDQIRIANILSSLDDKIELNNRINANLEEQAQALFRRWFVENKNKKWTYVDLGSVVKTTSGGTPSRSKLSYYENGTVKWLKSKELKGTYITQTEEKITQYAVENSSAKLLPQNSVLIAMYGATVGEYAIIAEKMTCNQAICALLPNENYPCFYLFMLAKNKKEELVNLAVGSAQQNISQVSIKQVQVPTCKELIRKYDKLVAPYFEKILNNIKQNQSLCQLRDILLPKLMNGEI